MHLVGRRLSILVGGAAIGGFLACGTFGAEDDDGPPNEDATATDATATDAPGDEGDGSSAADAPDPDDARSDGPTPLPCAVPTTVTLLPEADAPIASSAPDQPRGTDVSVCNMAVAACLMRFRLPAGLDAKVVTPGAVRLALSLTRANVHDECATDKDCTKATYRQQGNLYVSPLQPLWNETTVTWNSRETGNPWGSPGALKVNVDVLAQAGNVSVPAATTVARVDLDPRRWNLSFVAGGLIAVRTTFQSGGSPSAFVAVLRETSGNLLPVAPPRLEITYCP